MGEQMYDISTVLKESEQKMCKYWIDATAAAAPAAQLE